MPKASIYIILFLSFSIINNVEGQSFHYSWYKSYSSASAFISFDFVNETAFAVSKQSIYPVFGTGANIIDASTGAIKDSLYNGEIGDFLYLPISVTQKGILSANFFKDNTSACINQFSQITTSDFSLGYTDTNFETPQLRTYPTSIFQGNENLNYIFSYKVDNDQQCNPQNRYWSLHCIDGAGKTLWQKKYPFGNDASDYSGDIKAISDHELLLLGIGTCDTCISYNVPYLVKIDAITGQVTNKAAYEFNIDKTRETALAYVIEAGFGNLVVTAKQDIFFSGLSDVIGGGIIEGHPFIAKGDSNLHLLWKKEFQNRITIPNVRIMELANANMLVVFAERNEYKLWIYEVNPDGEIVDSNYVYNYNSLYDTPYRLSDAKLAKNSDLVLVGVNSKLISNGAQLVGGDAFMAVIGNVGIPVANKWEGNMIDVASYYMDNFEIYPNPVVPNTLTHVKSNKTGQLYLFNLVGQQVGSYPIVSRLQDVNLNAFAPAVYFYRFIPDDGVSIHTGKVVVE